MKRLLTCGLLLVFLITGTAHAQTPPSTQIDAYLSALEGLGFAGSVLVVQDGEIVLSEGYGAANLETDTPNTADTIFEIGSITKVFTGIAILQLEAQGKLKVDDPISQYLENVPADKAEITFRQLLQHRAGLGGYHGEDDFVPMSREAALDVILHDPLIFPPGAEQSYSNSGFTLLAILIEAISGQSYQDFIRANILIPAGMTRTGFPGDAFDDMAATETRFMGYSSPADWEYSWVLVGNGGIVSSTGDLYKLGQFVHQQTALLAAMEAEWLPGAVADLRFAGGGSAHDMLSIGQLGADDALIVLTNQAAYPARVIFDLVQSMLDGETFPLPPVAVDVDALTLAEYEGTYQLDSGGSLMVWVEGENLMIGAAGQDAIYALMTLPAEMQTELAALSERSAAIQQDIIAGEFESTVEAFGGDFSLEEVAQMEGNWQDFVDQYGAFQSLENLGTAPYYQGDIRDLLNILRLNFENGAIYSGWGWEDGTVVDRRIREEPLYPAMLRLIPIAENEFSSFSLDFPRNPILIFEGDSLILRGENGEVVAERVE